MCYYRLVQFSCRCLWGAEYVVRCAKPMEAEVTARGYTACQLRGIYPDMQRMWFGCWHCLTKGYEREGKETPMSFSSWGETITYLLLCETGMVWSYRMHVMNRWWRVRHVRSERMGVSVEEAEEVKRRTGYREVVKVNW
ncbi:uncharacterized protein LAJ45_08432 [Morchella importuna]|uniref:uncharacterized protein n=1 Tax=Morchella importuna TaxID=1174673 RepID=UPI001E8CFF72|nr:uncharacterized protein LAJ45_08432 [Morchella importuna]KAH8147604.1 hypothetical protein LAJ45_08432 [Morchella importuna]